MPWQAQLLPGTPDRLILRAVSLRPLHGYGILLRIAGFTTSSMVAQGALHPGLFRLLRQGILKTNWRGPRRSSGGPAF